MIGLVLVTHGRLAAEFIAAMEHVVGPQEQVEAVCIGPDDDMEARRADISAAAARVDTGRGVILLTDMFEEPLQPRHFPDGQTQCGSDRGHQSADADSAGKRAAPDGRRPRSGSRAGSRTKIYFGRLRDTGGGCVSEARTVEIVNKRGLHARASAKFVTVASGFDATIEVEKEGNRVCGTSIMGLMMLGAGIGDTIVISATGIGAAEAIASLVDLVENKFGED